MEHTCKYCGKTSKNSIGGHVSHCEKNPNRERNKLQSSNNFKKGIISKYGELKKYKVKCYTCEKEFEIEEREKTYPKKERYYCSRKCANSKKHSEETKLKIARTLRNDPTYTFDNPLKECIGCNKKLERSQKKYCSTECQKLFNYNNHIEKWKSGEISGGTGKYKDILSIHIRNYIFKKFESKCVKCGWHEINPITNKTPLGVDHIDGNSKNNNEFNLDLLCPNCHSLTPTYGSLNNGKGRESMRKYKVVR